jgi:hypothetical protein
MANVDSTKQTLFTLFSSFLLGLAPVILPILAFVSSGCGGSSSNSSSKSGASQVRVLQLLPTQSLVDISLDATVALTSENILTLQNVQYLESTGYLGLEETLNELVLTVRDSESGRLLINEPIQPLKGKNSLYISGTDSEPLLFTSTDNFFVPAEGLARLRFLNASESNNPLDFYLTPAGIAELGLSPTKSNVSFTESSEYVEVLTGRYRIRATPTGVREVVLDSGEVLLSSRSVSTALAVQSSQDDSAISVLFVPDQQ